MAGLSPRRDALTSLVELGVMSNFSFLRGASHPEELVVTADRLGLAGMALCDRNTVAGVVRAHMAAREAGLPYQPGCRLAFADDTPDCLVLPRTITGWNNLCRLLSTGNLRAPKGECRLTLDDLLQWGGDLAIVLVAGTVLPVASGKSVRAVLCRLNEAFPRAVRLAVSCHNGPACAREMAWPDSSR